MGWLNRLMGYPDLDPTGTSTELFKKVAQQAITMYSRGDVERSMNHLKELMATASRTYGEYHADVGRSALLMAVLMIMSREESAALYLCESAVQVLQENKEVAPRDLDAAVLLQSGLERIVENQRPVEDDGYLLVYGTPIGEWLRSCKS